VPDSPDINAGAWYLRAAGERSWEVCEPVTGEVRAQVMATGNPAATVTATGDPAAAAAGAEAVARFLVQLVAEPRQGLGQ
jgi:hypothetical protein